MDTSVLDRETISRYIPNKLAEVDGEAPLSEKLDTYIASAKMWLENEFLGPEDFLSDSHNDLALKILVAKAFADAVPSLDLVVTPTGMAVIKSEDRPPHKNHLRTVPRHPAGPDFRGNPSARPALAMARPSAADGAACLTWRGNKV